MRNKYVCDLCGKEVEEKAWTDSPSEFFVQTYCASQNPLADARLMVFASDNGQSASIKIKDCCQQCQKVLSKAIADTLVQLRG